MTQRKHLVSTRILGLGVLILLGGCREPVEETAARTLTLEPTESAVSPGPSTTLRLVLRLEEDRFRLVSAVPKRGTVLEPPIEEERDSLLERKTLLVEYAARDAGRAILVTGFFLVPLEADVEFLDPDVRYRIRRDTEPLPSPLVKVSIPFDPDVATVDFHWLEPDPEAPPEKWERVSLGEVEIEQGKEEQDDLQ